MHCLKTLALAAVLAGAAAAQTAAPQASHPKKAEAPAASSAPQDANEPVITIENLCAKPKASAECKTVVTKAEFDRILGTVKGNVPPNARMQLAQRYVELVTFADKAEQAGLEKSPEFQETFKLLRMQALATAYTHHLQDTAAKVSDADVEQYYAQNKPAYEEVTLKRIYIPRPVSRGDKKPPLDDAATKALAEKIQARAAAGEDMDKLEQEVYVAENPDASKDTAPPTTLGPRRRGQLPATHESKIFDLAAGQASPLLEEPSGFFIYKVESKQVLPLAQVKPQIARQLEEQKMKDAVEQTISSVKATFNDSYFKPPVEPGARPLPHGAKEPGQPPAGGKPSTPEAPPASQQK